jgi:hypothetical protein
MAWWGKMAVSGKKEKSEFTDVVTVLIYVEFFMHFLHFFEFIHSVQTFEHILNLNRMLLNTFTRVQFNIHPHCLNLTNGLVQGSHLEAQELDQTGLWQHYFLGYASHLFMGLFRLCLRCQQNEAPSKHDNSW